MTFFFLYSIICFLIALTILICNINTQNAITANKKLAAWIQDDTNCPALDWSVASIDDISDGCYHWTSDFRITANLTDNDMNAAILPETMNCKNIVYNRWVEKYMTYDFDVCHGDSDIEARNPKFSWKKKYDMDLQEKIFAAQGTKARPTVDKPKKQDHQFGKSDGECHTQTVTDWRSYAESGWEFPSNNPADQGHQTVWSSPAQHALVPVNGHSSNIDLHFNFASFNNNKLSSSAAIGSIFALSGSDFQAINPIKGTFYSNPDLEAERFYDDNAPLCREAKVDINVEHECKNSFPLCFSDSGIQHWIGADLPLAGLTTAEFQLLSSYGNTTDFPSCYTNPSKGDYRVRSYCRGDEHYNIFIIADIKKEKIESNNYLTVNIIKRDQFPDTDNGLEVSFFAYMNNSGGLTKDQVMSEYIRVLDDIDGASQEIAYSFFGFFGIMSLFLMMRAKAKMFSSFFSSTNK